MILFVLYLFIFEEEEKELKVVLKSKPIDTETCNVINKMAANCGFALASNHEKYKKKTGFKYIVSQ